MLKPVHNRRVFLLTTAILFVIFAVVFLFSNNVLAQDDLFGTEYAENVGLSSEDIRVSVIKVIRTVLGVLGVLALLIILYGGFVWMTARGDAQQIERAKKILLNAVIGLIIIMMAFAIVQYIFSILSGGGGTGGPGGCTPGETRGSCELCVAPPDTGRWEWQYDWPGCDSILPENIFRINDVQTSHGEPLPGHYPFDEDKSNVYWCSKIQTVFNHHLNSGTVDAAHSEPLNITDPLRVVASLTPEQIALGDWQTRGNVLIFTPENDEFINQNTDHSEHLPASLEDTDGRFLSDCSLSAGCEGAPPPDFYWNFYVGNEGDIVNPYITSTYPQSSDPDNPDTNVSRDPIIDVSFSENIDASTVLDINGINPYPGHIYLQELDSGGNIVGQIDNSILIIEMKGGESDSKGFTMYLEEPNLLKSFTYYQVTVQDIEDLCGNVMDPNNYTWRFATNDVAPGVSSYYPTGSNVCPDTHISITFNTSMYNNSVRMQITGSSNVWNYLILPGAVSDSDANGEFRVADAGVPESTHYKVYEFIPASDLDENTSYNIYVDTDKIIDAQGTELYQEWNFTVTDLENCVCTPYISHLSKDSGPVGDCITVNGHCFTGTDAQPATISYIHFDNTPAIVPADYSNTAVGTTVPLSFNEDDRPAITLAIEYQSGNTVPPSNSKDFLITAGQANGPCLWSVNPNHGPRGLTGLRLSGIRFGDYADQVVHQAVFTPNAVFDITNAGDWTNIEITNVVVPSATQDGEVVVVNSSGTSNGIYFDVTYCGNGVIEAGEDCDNANLGGKDCSDLGWVGGSLSCDATCKFDTLNCSNAPQVAENSNCAMGCNGVASDTCYNDTNCDPGIQCLITDFPSPNPYKNNEDVCLNAAISADFNTDIDQNTFTNSNIFIQQCADQTCSGGLINVSAQITGTTARSFVLEPTAGNLNPETYYQVTITTGIQSTAGINMEQDYVWKFKTKSDTADCPLERVYVEPHDAIAGASQSLSYYAVPTGPFCTVLSGADNYDWTWTNDSTPNLGVNVIEDLANDSNATVTTADQQGTVYIKAETESKYDRGKLNITFDTCAFNPDICNQNCPGSVCDLIVDRCTPVINSLSPNSGPAGRWVTLSGCYFKNGRNSGHVDFDATQVSVYPCGESWTDTEILIAVPNGLSPASYSVKVTDRYGLESNDNLNFSLINDCQAGVPTPATGLPGICTINPNSGMPGDNVGISGENFGNSQDSVTFNGDEAVINNWSANSINAQVPDNSSSGNVVVSVENCPSNGLYFEIQSGGIGDPCDGNIQTPECDADNNLCWSGLYCDPDSACTCQPVANANIVPASRHPYPSSQCRNTVVSATFDRLMDNSTINQNTVQLWESTHVGRDGCVEAGLDDEIIGPGNGSTTNLFSKILALIKNFFKSSASAQQANYWCPISGRVSSYDIADGLEHCNNPAGCTVFTFSPNSPLSSNSTNEIHIKAGENGARTALGGELNITSPTRSYTSYPDGSYYWHFTVGNRICQIDYVNVDISFQVDGQIITRNDAVYDYFTCAGRDDCRDDIRLTMDGNQHRYIASTYDRSGVRLSASYEWTKHDEKNLINNISDPDRSNTYITPNPMNGESIIRVTASDSNPGDDIDYGSASTAVTVTNFLCQNPWPSLETFPFQDSGNNCTIGAGLCYDMTFSTYYCRDYGQMGDYCSGGSRNGMDCETNQDCLGSGECLSSTADDLPALIYPGNIKGLDSGYWVGGSDHGKMCDDDSDYSSVGYCYNVLKDFMFIYDNGWCSLSNTLCTDSGDCPSGEICEICDDSIGIRIYGNGEHLSSNSWYEKYANQPGSYSDKIVDSYQAISSGRTTYVNFAIDNAPLKSNPIYTDMFLLSYTDNYKPVTLNIHDQLLEYLKFNTNGIDNARICSGSGTYCERNTDCSGSETCDADKEKLTRDVIRLGAVSEMIYHLDLYRGYCSAHNNLACLQDTNCPDSDDDENPEFCVIQNDTYPMLESGTYIQNQTVSVWDSWNDTFASLLGTSLLLDPINEAQCNKNVGYNEECWNEEINNFQCNPESYMHHYKASTVEDGYSIYTNMEYSPSGWVPAPAKGVSSTSFSQPCSAGTYNLIFTITN